MMAVGKHISFAGRMLARNPGFTCVAVLTLALAIGANTAIFSIVEGVLLKPLPFPHPERLAIIWQKSASGPQLGISELDLNDYRARTRVFEALGGYTAPGTKSVILTGAGDPADIAPSYITQNYFSVLGVRPRLGRDFLPDEGLRGRNGVAILSHACWQSRFGGARDILQRQITINKQKLQVVGVMGRDVFPADVEIYLPFTRVSPEQPLPRNYHELNVVGRLRPGHSVAEAQREMTAISAELEHLYPATNTGIGSFVRPLRLEITGNVRDPILILLAAVGLVLLIACSNVANLLLVRAAARQKEIAIRVAMGAGRDHIIIQFLTECLLLAAAGAVLGLLLAYWTMPLIQTLGKDRIPRLQHVALDSGVLLFTAGISVSAALIFGLIPALKYSSANLNQTLRAGGRTSLSDSGQLRNVLVASEVAIAFMVLVGASLLVRSLNQLFEIHPGFRTHHLLVGQIALPPSAYPRTAVHDFYARLLPKIAALPGVVSVATGTALPLASPVTQTRFTVQGASPSDPGRYPVTAIASVDAEFFRTMAIPILRGRTFTAQEIANPDDERCIISNTLARNHFNGQDPIGRIILTNLAARSPEPCRIVGVAGDTRVEGLDAPPAPVTYFAAYTAKEMLVVRTAGDPMTVAAAIRREVAAVDPDQPLSALRRMEEVVSHSLSRRSFAAVLLGMFALLGLILATLGLYGVVSYSVTQRTQEIGVRMALGADARSVFRLVVSHGLSVTAVGLIFGITAAAGVTRAMSGLLFGVGFADPISFGAGCVLLLTVSAVASFVPAYRAARVDPVVCLRYE